MIQNYTPKLYPPCKIEQNTTPKKEITQVRALTPNEFRQIRNKQTKTKRFLSLPQVIAIDWALSG